MANRFILKQFAGEATTNQTFGSYQTGTPNITNDAEQIQSLPAWAQGWLAATTNATMIPRFGEMQGLQYVLCKAIKEIYSEGVPLWDAGETYYRYSIAGYVADGVFNLYYNKTGTFSETPPDQDTANWALLDDVFTTKAALESPSFAGTPTAPTPGVGASAQQIATVGFVQSSVSSYETPIVPITETQGEITLLTNTMYKMTISGATTFVLPASPNADVYNQIKILANVTVAQADLINFGTNGNYFNRTAPDTSAIGSYDIYLDYDPNLSSWVAGVLAKGTE